MINYDGTTWFDREGHALVTADFDKDRNKWLDEMKVVEALLADRDYKIIKQEYTKRKKYWVSTVWLGIDHGWGEGPPLIFETMVFSGRLNRWMKGIYDVKRWYYRETYDQIRYHTEDEAEKGHEKMVAKYNRLEKK